MAEMNAADFAKELLRSCQNAKPYDKKADSKSNDMAQLNILLSKFTKSFDANFKKMENYLNQIAAAAKNNQKNSEESAKLTKMQIDAYKGNKLKKNTEAEQNYFKQNKKVGDAALRYYKKALEKGSIYVHDVGAHKFLHAINTALRGANPFGEIDISKMFTAEFYKSIEDGIGSAATTANEAIKKEPPADAKKPPSKGGGEDKEVHLSEHDPLETSASMIRIAKVLSLINKVESALFGLGEKQKGIQELTFGGLVKNEVAFMSASREAAFELGNATKETQGLLTANEKIGRTVSETGADRDDFQQNYLKNLKAGVKNIKTAQQITVSQLNTERQLGMAAGDLNETFRDFAVAGRMNEGQIADMGRGMREVARNTGLTGESLKAAVSSSKSFTENLRKAATLTATASKNVLEATANFQKLGVAEAGGELLKKLTSSTDLLMDSTSKTATFLYMAAGSAGKIGDLQKGTLLKSKQGIKELAKGMENVLKKFGVSSLEAVDQLSDEAKVSINFQLKTTLGVELGEARSLIEAVKETGKTFGDRLDDVQKKLNGNITAEEKIAILEEKRRLETSKSLEVLTALDEAAKGAKDMNQALSTFSKRKGEFENDIKAMGGSFTDGIDAARTAINTSLKSINEGLLKAGKQQIKIDTSEIENALKDPTALRELSAKLSKGEQQLATAQKSQLDPIKQTEQTLREYNDFFRSYSSSIITGVLGTIGAIGIGTIAVVGILTMISLQVMGIMKALDGFLFLSKKPTTESKPGWVEYLAARIKAAIRSVIPAAPTISGGGTTGTSPVATTAANAANAAPGAAASTSSLKSIGTTMLTSAAQITAVLGPLLLLIAATTLLVSYMIKKFDIKPADVMFASIGLGILLLAAGGIMYALTQGEKDTEKKTGGKMISAKALGKMALMGIILTLASGVIVTLMGGIFAIVHGVLKSTKFKAGEGFKASQGLMELFMISGALFAAIAGLFHVVENGSNLFGAKIWKSIGLMLLLGLGLYLFGGALVQFMASMVQFVQSVLQSMKLDAKEILNVAAKLGAMAVVLGVLVGVILMIAGAVKLLALMFPNMTFTISVAPLASGALLQLAGAMAILLVGMLAFAAIGYLFGADLIANIAIGAAAVIIMALAMLIIAAAIIGLAAGVSALSSTVKESALAAALAPLASWQLIIFSLVVAGLAIAMMVFATLINSSGVDVGAIMQAVLIVTVVMLACALIAGVLMLGLWGIIALGSQIAGMQVAASYAWLAAGALILLGIALGLLMFGMALLVDIVSRSNLKLESIVYTVSVIVALALGVGLIGAAIGFGLMGLIQLQTKAGPFLAAAGNAAIGLGLIAIGVAIVTAGILLLWAASELLSTDILLKVATTFTLLTLALVAIAIGAVLSALALVVIAAAGVSFIYAAALGTLGLFFISTGLEMISDSITAKNPKGHTLEETLNILIENLYIFDYFVEVMEEIASSFMSVIPSLSQATISAAMIFVWGVLFGVASVLAYVGLLSISVGLGYLNAGFGFITEVVNSLYDKIEFLRDRIPEVFRGLASAFIVMASSLAVIIIAASLLGAIAIAAAYQWPALVTGLGLIAVMIIGLGFATYAITGAIKQTGLDSKGEELKKWSGIFSDIAKIMIDMSTALMAFSRAMSSLSFSMFFMGGSSIRKNEKTGEETTVIGIILADIFNALEMMVERLQKVDLDPAELKKMSEKTQIIGEMMKEMSKVIASFAKYVLPIFQKSIMQLITGSSSTIDQIIASENDIRNKLPKVFGVVIYIGEQFAQAVADMGLALNSVDKAKKLGELSKAIGEMMTNFAYNLPYIRQGAENLIKQSKEQDGWRAKIQPVQNTLAEGIEALKLIIDTISPKIQSLTIDESLGKKLNIASSVLVDLGKSFSELGKVVNMFVSGYVSSGELAEFTKNKEKYKNDMTSALNAIVELLTAADTKLAKMKNFDALPKKLATMGEATKNMGKALEAFKDSSKVFTSKKLTKDLQKLAAEGKKPATNVAALFIGFVYDSFVQPILDKAGNPAKVTQALEAVSASAKATEAVASVLDKFGKDFGKLFASKNIENISKMIGEVTKDAGIVNLGKFLGDFFKFIDTKILAEINKINFDNILNSQDVLVELPKVIDGLVSLFRSFGELTRFAQSKELKRSGNQKTAIDVLNAWTTGTEGQQLGQAIANFMTFAQDQLLKPIVGVMGKINLDTMMDASDAMKTISDVMTNLQKAMVSFGELGAMLTKQKGSGANATTYAKQLTQFMNDLQRPGTGEALGLLPDFFTFISGHLLAPLVKIDTGGIGPEELKVAAETLETIPKVITSLANMMKSFDQTFSGGTKNVGGKSVKQVADFIPKATEMATELGKHTESIGKLFKTISEGLIDPIFNYNLPPGDVKEAGDSYAALSELLPKFASFMMAMEANLSGINFNGVGKIIQNLSSISSINGSGLVEHFANANDYLTTLLGTMEATLEKMTRVMDINAKINGLGAQITVGSPVATVQNNAAGAAGGATAVAATSTPQVATVPTSPTTATAPGSPAVAASINNTTVSNTPSTIQEANSKSINDNLVSAVNLLSQILSATNAQGGSALSGSGGTRTASTGAGMAGGAGNALGGTSDTTSA